MGGRGGVNCTMGGEADTGEAVLVAGFWADICMAELELGSLLS